MTGKARLEQFREYLSAKADPSSPRTRRENVLLALYATAVDQRRRDQIAAVRVILAYDLGLPSQALQVDHSSTSPQRKVIVYLPDNGRGPNPRLVDSVVDEDDDRSCFVVKPMPAEGNGS